MIAYKPYTRRETGQVKEIQDLPLSSVFNAAMGYGREFLQAQNAVQRMVEMGVAGGRVLSQDEANEKYSMPGLEFNDSVLEGQAQLMRRRKELENARTFYLQNAKGFSGNSVAFAAMIIGSQMSFTDIGLNFVPIVGQAKYTKLARFVEKSKGAKTFRAGGGLGRPVIRRETAPFLAQRYRMSAGLIAESRGYAARVTQGAIDAMIGNLIAEIPIFMANRQQQAEYGLRDVAFGMAGSAILGGGLRGAGILFERLTAPTKREMAAVAQDQFVNDVDIDVSGIARLDRAAIAEEIIADEARKIRDNAEIRRLAKKAVDEQMADIEAAVGASGRWLEDITRTEIYEAKLGAKNAVEAKRAKIAAKVRAKIESVGVLGRVTRDQVVQIAEDAAKRSPKSQHSKILGRLLERLESGDGSAADNLARMFYLELDEAAREVPGLFKTGEVSPKFTLGQLKAIGEIMDLLPDRASKMMRRISSERLDVDARTEAAIQAKADKIERKAYRRRLAELKNSPDLAAGKFRKRVAKERAKRYKAEVRRLQAEYSEKTQQLIEDTFQQRMRDLVDAQSRSKVEPGREPIPSNATAGKEGVDTSFHRQDSSDLEAALKRDGDLTPKERLYLDASFDYEPKAITDGLDCMIKG